MKGIVMGQTSSPPVTEHYWRHLPRMVLSMSILRDLFASELAGEKNVRILDLGASHAFAAFMHQCMSEMGTGWSIDYATMDGGNLQNTSTSGVFERPSIKVDVSRGALPFERDCYDVVVFAEVLEHLNVHPQKVLSELSRIIKPGALLFLTTPNVTSWKKLFNMSNGAWGFDSPTFSGEYGHRYEYSYYQIRSMLLLCNFFAQVERAEDVYFDDPVGIKSCTQLLGFCFFKIVSGDFRAALKLWLRRGSGLFFVGKKESVAPVSPRLMDV